MPVPEELGHLFDATDFRMTEHLTLSEVVEATVELGLLSKEGLVSGLLPCIP